MAEWREVKLGSACTKIGSGATPRGGKDAYLESGDIFLIRSQNIYNDGFKPHGLAYISQEQADQLSNVVVQENDILLNITGDSVARTCLAPNQYLPARVNQHVAIIRPDEKKLDSRFIRYSLTSPFMQNHMLGLAASGATRNALTKGMIESFSILCPSLSEQRAIADVLSALDDKIELNRKMNETLEAMARALFKSWFMDFDPVRARMEGSKPDGLSDDLAALFPNRLVDSPLGPIPEGWEAGCFGQIAENFDSKRIPLSSREREKRVGQYPYHGATSVMGYVDDFLFDGIHVLIGEDGSVAREDGTPYTQYVWGKIWVNNHAHVLRGKGSVSNEQLYIFVSQTNISGYVTGAVQPKLNQKNMNAIPMIIAPESINEAFSKIVTPLFAKLRESTDLNIQLTAMRDTLLPKLISGQLRVA
ncbi:MAG: restriction endonuclease subunit S [Rickettsiales bacterium]